MNRFPFLLFFGFIFCFSQTSYKSENVLFSDYLPSDVIFKTFKKDNYLYIATQKGLFVYDGYMFVESKGVQDAVRHFYQDNGGIYLEENTKGLIYIKSIFSTAKIIQKVDYSDSNPDNDHYENIFKDQVGNIWSSDFHNIKYFNSFTRKKILFPIKKNSGLLDFKISYYQDGKNLLLFTSEGIYYWKHQTNSLKKIRKEKIVSTVETNVGIFLLTSSGAIVRFSLNSSNQIIKLDTSLFNHKFVKQPLDQGKIASYDDENVYEIDLKTFSKQKIFSTDKKINHVSMIRTIRYFGSPHKMAL